MKKINSVIMAILLSSLVYSNAMAAGPKKINKCTTISKSGSYVVNRNLQATAKTAGNCIVIDADFVTLDLNGFTLTGLGDGTGVGVWNNDVPHQGLLVRNGMITGFQSGISFPFSRGSTVESIKAFSNDWTGIRVYSGSTVTGNTASDNGFTGILVGFGSIVVANTASDNGRDGMNVGTRSTVTANRASNNGANGLNIGLYSTVTGNIASGNNAKGLGLFCPSNIIGNTASGNSGQNIALSGFGCRQSNNLGL